MRRSPCDGCACGVASRVLASRALVFFPAFSAFVLLALPFSFSFFFFFFALFLDRFFHVISLPDQKGKKDEESANQNDGEDAQRKKCGPR